MPYFETVDDVTGALAGHGYIADRQLATAVFIQTQLDKPLLVEGPAGVGKTELAKAIAAATGRRLLRLQALMRARMTPRPCTSGTTASSSCTPRSCGRRSASCSGHSRPAVPRSSGSRSRRAPSSPSASLPAPAARSHPLTRSRGAPDRRGWHRAQTPWEAVLLEMLAEYQVSVPEIGTFVARHPPYATSLRRTPATCPPRSGAAACTCFSTTPAPGASSRSCGARRPAASPCPPSTSSRSSADCAGSTSARRPASRRPWTWARTLAVLGVEESPWLSSSPTPSRWWRDSRDVRRALDALPSLVDPNTALADEPGRDHPHDHDHGHGHSAEHRHDDRVTDRTPVTVRTPCNGRTGGESAGPTRRA